MTWHVQKLWAVYLPRVVDSPGSPTCDTCLYFAVNRLCLFPRKVLAPKVKLKGKWHVSVHPVKITGIDSFKGFS